MKTNHIYFFLISILLIAVIQSCSTYKSLTADSYVEGEILGIPTNEKFGIMLLNHDHYESYIALIRLDKLEISERFSWQKNLEVYAKIETIEGVPFATSISESPFPNSSLVPVKTNLDFHILESHGMIEKIHRKGHRIKFEVIGGEMKYTMEYFDNNGNREEETFSISGPLHQLVETYQLNLNSNQFRPFFYETNRGEIITVDTCHSHFYTQDTCTYVQTM